MRVALVLAPWEAPASGGPGAESVTWLASTLGAFGFQVAVITAGDEAQLVQALVGLKAEDTLLVHVSGRLARRGVLRVSGGRWMPLRVVGEALAAHAAADVSVLAELAQEQDAEDALVAADHVASAVSALGARERGYGVVVAVRSASSQLEELGFTRVFFETASSMSARGQVALLSTVYETVKTMPDSFALAQSFTLLRGRSELELASAAPPADLDALDDRLDEAIEAGQFARVVELHRQRLPLLGSPRQRVRELLAIARVLQQDLGDVAGAVAALEEARAIEPRRGSVLQALRRAYESAGLWASAIEATGALADVTPMQVDRAALRYEQALMAVDRLHDDELARTWLEQALEDDPSHMEARAALALLRSSLSVAEPMPVPPEPEPEPPSTPDEEGDELDPRTHLAALDERIGAGRTDAAFLSAMALEELGFADSQAGALIAHLRTVAPLRARERLDAAAWELLRPYGMDEVLGALFAAVARPGSIARVEQLDARGRLVQLDPQTRLDASSTASVVRSFQWAARVLGTPCPDLYVLPEVPGEIAAVRAPAPSTAVGHSVASGRSAKDLAFLAGRHLTYYRPEYHVLVSFPTREELTRLLLAAVALTKPDVPPTGEGSRAVAALAARLERLINDEERAQLRRAVWELEVRGGKFSTSAWTRNVDLLAARAGLLLCGDLATAMAIVSTEARVIAGLPLEARRRDLIGFCVSDEHAELRARFATTAQSTRPPPPPGAGQS